MPNLGTIVCYVLVSLVFAGAVRLYLRDARDRRAGLGDDAFAWRRNPNTIRPAAPKPVLQVLPRRWGWRHAMIAVAQVMAVGGGLWLSFIAGDRTGEVVPPIAYLVAPLGWICLVAFATAVLTRVWDLSVAALARRGGWASKPHQSVGEADRVLAPRRRLGEGA